MQYELLVPDYLNNGLDSATRKKFEEELLHNVKLQTLLEQERAWSLALTRNVSVRQPQDLSEFRRRIECRNSWFF